MSWHRIILQDICRMDIRLRRYKWRRVSRATKDFEWYLRSFERRYLHRFSISNNRSRQSEKEAFNSGSYSTFNGSMESGQWVERLVTHDIDDQEKWSTLSTVIRSGDWKAICRQLRLEINKRCKPFLIWDYEDDSVIEGTEEEEEEEEEEETQAETQANTVL